jgi:hypothetical protein
MKVLEEGIEFDEQRDSSFDTKKAVKTQRSEKKSLSSPRGTNEQNGSGGNI